MKNIHITTLGCSKNDVDSDVLKGQIEVNKLNVVDSVEESDIMVINTCGFIEAAKEQSVNAILEAIEVKKNNPSKKVFVAGCLSARYKDELKDELPEVDEFFGTEDYSGILSHIDENAEVKEETLYAQRSVSSDEHYAYIKISEGCNHTCNFCAIPAMRGKHRSRLIEDVVAEAEQLAEKGVKEVILIAQDSTYYGRDTYKKPMLGKLLEALDHVDGIEWIRVMYAYPLSFPKDVIPVMKNSTKICNYVDMPVQHISDHMIQKMNRGTKKEYTFRIMRMMREEIPNMTLRTTLIVGHPGETEEDHQESIDFIKEFKFNRLGVFTYSDEDGTPSAEMEDKVPMDVKIRRMNEIMEVQRDISLELNREKIGKTIRVLVDEYDAEQQMFIARSEADAPEIDNAVMVDYSSEINVGNFYTVSVYDASEYELYAKLDH